MKYYSILLLTMFFSFASFGGEKQIVAKFWDSQPILTAEGATAPDPAPDRWGKWKFWNGQWWAQHMFQPESAGVSWDAPKTGFDQGKWQQYHAAWIRAQKEIPAEWQDGRLIFSLDGIKCKGVTLFINGKKVSDIKPPVCEFDIASSINFGKTNEFLLLLDGGNSSAFKLEKSPPYLEPKAPESVDDVFANTSWRQKTLTVETEVTVARKSTVEVVAEVFDADGRKVKSVGGKYTVEPGTTVVKPSVKWEDPITWEIGRGYLYTLKTNVKINGRAFPYKDVKFGFREIWRDDRYIFMNGHRQSFRVTYNFGCNKYGGKFLTNVGYNTIQFAHRTELDPTISEEDLEYYSANGIGVIEPTTAFNFNSKNGMLKPGAKREDFKAMQAKNLKRYRNWPCIVMMYMGVNTYLPLWAYEAVHLGSGDNGDFAKMMDDLVAEAKKTNPNVLYFSHSDGNTGEIASANLYFNWVPMQEREDWPSRWSVRGHFPFQACEFGHPYQYSWFRDGRDCVTEFLAIYYGDEAYDTEPRRIARNHKAGIWLGRVQHPCSRTLQSDFAWRVHRAWRTFGINAGIVWFNLDTGYGLPGWTMDRVWDGYPEPAYNFFKSEADVPKGRPDWALPYFDIYRKGNEDFLGWVAGYPRITDRRHAYGSGDELVKQAVMLWDRFDTKSFTCKWCVRKGETELASGEYKRELKTNIPSFEEIRVKLPFVKEKTPCTISAAFYDDKGTLVAEDSCGFEIYPPQPANMKPLDATKVRVIQPFTLKNATELPWKEIDAGLKVLVLQQGADFYKSLGFDVEDIAPRKLYLRDKSAAAYSTLDDGDLCDWYGQPLTELEQKYDYEPYGHILKRGGHGPRWNYNMALGGLVVRTPDTVGYLPVIEGEFDGNYSGVLRRYVGKGEIIFSTLSTEGRFATNELKGEPVEDPAAKKTLSALYADLASPSDPHTRTVIPSGAYAERLMKEIDAPSSQASNLKPSSSNILLCGPDSPLSGKDVVSALQNGANVLIMGNAKLAEALQLQVETATVTPSSGVFKVTHDLTNRDLRAIGRNLFHFRDAYNYDKLVDGNGWKIDAEGMFASRTFKNGTKAYVTQYETFKLEDTIATETECYRFGKIEKVTDQLRKDYMKRCDISFERSRQFAARLLTLLGAGSALPGDKPPILYHGLSGSIDPYHFGYW